MTSPETSRQTMLLAQLLGLAIAVGLTLFGLVLILSGTPLGWFIGAAGLVLSAMLIRALVLWFKWQRRITDSGTSGGHERID